MAARSHCGDRIADRDRCSSAAAFLAKAYVHERNQDHRESDRRRKFFSTIIAFAAGLAVVILWAHPLKQKGTFLGLLGAGVAIALREPLLSIAGRLAIFAGHMYTAGDRIELQKMTGDVIDIGFFYTRMLEVGAWIGGDQYSGRILLIPNSMIFGNPINNYTLHLSYIWGRSHIADYIPEQYGGCEQNSH